MRLPRFTTRRLMVLVAVVAVNIGLIRGVDIWAADPGLPFGLLAYALVPPMSLLVVAAARVRIGLAKRGQAPPFSVGYLLVGGLVSFGVCLAFATQTIWLLIETVTVPVPVPVPSAWEETFDEIFLIALLTLPQMVLALVGGVLSARHRLTIVLEGRVSRRGRVASESDSCDSPASASGPW